MLSDQGKECFGFYQFVHWILFRKHKRLTALLDVSLHIAYDLMLMPKTPPRELFLAAAMAAHAVNKCPDLIDHEKRIAIFLRIDRKMRNKIFARIQSDRVARIYNVLVEYGEIMHIV